VLTRKLYLALALVAAVPGASRAEPQCLDGFCIGQNITNIRFEQVHWLTPKKDVTEQKCNGVGCQPALAFRGYAPEIQQALANALRFTFGLPPYNIISDENLAVIRQYKYECNPSARGGISGQRRFFGVYRSQLSGHLTVVGLRLQNGELNVYRIARQFPYHSPAEFADLEQKLRQQFGDRLLYVDYLASNAATAISAKRLDGYFGRSEMFNPTDLADNLAEVVLVDPLTRQLLEPTSFPESGEIRPLPVRIPEQCNLPVSIQ
jgi:hypothetical protein